MRRALWRPSRARLLPVVDKASQEEAPATSRGFDRLEMWRGRCPERPGDPEQIRRSGIAMGRARVSLDELRQRNPRACVRLQSRDDYYDYYGVGRGENSDGARNHTRIGAVIECSETDYRTGIDTMAALLRRKAFVVPKPGAPAIEPEDDGAPVTDPMRRSSF